MTIKPHQLVRDNKKLIQRCQWLKRIAPTELKVAEVARILGLSAKQVRYLVNTGQLEGFKRTEKSNAAIYVSEESVFNYNQRNGLKLYRK